MMRVTYILVMKPGIFPRRVPVVYAEYSKQQKQNFLYICECTKFLHRMGHVPIREKVEHGPNLCVGGMLSPKLYTKCGRPLGG